MQLLKLTFAKSRPFSVSIMCSLIRHFPILKINNFIDHAIDPFLSHLWLRFFENFKIGFDIDATFRRYNSIDMYIDWRFGAEAFRP
jgi:hypothetical protein